MYYIYIYKSYVIYNIYDSMTLHMWYLYENHDDGSICILTTPSNSLYVAALLLRVFFRGSEDMRRQRWPKRSAGRRIWFCQRGRHSDFSGTSVGVGCSLGAMS
jgi:hypothetical protein